MKWRLKLRWPIRKVSILTSSSKSWYHFQKSHQMRNTILAKITQQNFRILFLIIQKLFLESYTSVYVPKNIFGISLLHSLNLGLRSVFWHWFIKICCWLEKIWLSNFTMKGWANLIIKLYNERLIKSDHRTLQWKVVLLDIWNSLHQGALHHHKCVSKYWQYLNQFINFH